MQDLQQLIPEPIRMSMAELDYSLSHRARNPRICGILDNTVLASGKRLRPLLTFLMGDLLGLGHEDIIPYALDIERIHAATLAHDDVVDEADTRRGSPTLNRTASNKRAILAGDYLLAQVLQEVAERGDPIMVKELSRVISDLVEGEWLQIENTKNKALSFRDVEQVALMKTGSVIRWCCIAPCLIMGSKGSRKLLKLTRSFGESIGLAFQLGDDLLDFVRKDGSELADLNSGVISSVVFYLLAGDQDQVDASLYQKGLHSFDEVQLKQAMTKVRVHLHQHLSAARHSFDEILRESKNTPTSGPSTTEAFQNVLHYLALRA